MKPDSPYIQQVRLLMQMLPFVAEGTCFALKGGTAINLFVRDVPRLSVDVDLVYLPGDDRQSALTHITQALDRIARRLEDALPGLHCVKSYENKPDALRLVVTQAGVSVKIELSPVLRGTVLPPQTRTVTEIVESEFGFAEMSVVSIADLYAGKLCAAFDRQHPRDLFDVMLLMANEGITDAIRQAFLVYVVSHPRPMEELLAPRWKALDAAFHAEFDGMTRQTTSVEALRQAGESALQALRQQLTQADKAFLTSFYRQTPTWDQLPFDHIRDLPAIRWKQTNIARMSGRRRQNALHRLEAVLAAGTDQKP